MITYHYRGPIERLVRDSHRRSMRFTIVDGFSADGPTGGVLYPWMTKRECVADAAAQGERARFVRNDEGGPSTE